MAIPTYDEWVKQRSALNSSGDSSMARMHVAVVLASLIGGGTERMRLNLIRKWTQRGIEVDLVVARFKGELVNHIPDRVQVFEVAPRHPLFFGAGLRRYVRHRKPTHILSAGRDINVLTLWALRRSAKQLPIFISSHSHPSTQLGSAQGIRRLKFRAGDWALRRLVRHSRGVIAVSHGIAAELRETLALPSNRITVIHNPTITEETDSQINMPFTGYPSPSDSPTIIFVGRLEPQKGVDSLVEAFACIQGQTSAHLIILGEGSQQKTLATQAEEKKLSSRIHFVGFQDNPLPWIKQANVLALPSRFEGLPNVLIEALACGTQIVSTNCPTGPAEILRDGQFGQLVPVDDPSSLGAALLAALNGDYRVPPDKLRARAELFRADRAAENYLRLLLGRD